jgi:hypothetical protein
MAIIASKILWWEAVADASSYKVRIVPDGQVAADNSNLADFNGDTVPAGTGPEVEVDIRSLSSVPIVEGTYDLFISALDEAGNESDPLVIGDAILDFQPPAAPRNGGFR